ncbi:MAG: tetratricopeptide repeat protein [Labilibaculum sp.]|nr:tetratricopeptide repeat protein [Labilibaculum sp.]MBI9058602.1 tetratricopeptide repeat protein [Labilibaculum sp.]
MRKLILLLLCISCFLLSFGQKVDFVENTLDSIQEINSKIEFLNDWTGKNYRTQSEVALFYSQECLKLAQANNNNSGAGDALVRIGLIQKRKGNYTEALNLYNQAIDHYKISNDSIGINRTKLNRGNLYKNTEKYNLALKDYFQSLSFLTTQKDHKACALINNSIGLVYKQLKDYEKALNYYKESAKICSTKNLVTSLYYCYNNIGNLLSIKHNFQDALFYYKKNLDVLKEKPNNYKQAQTYHNIGACFLEMKQYSLAMEYQKKSLKLKEAIGNKGLIITSLNGLSHSNYMTNNLDDALKYSRRALLLEKEIGNIEYQITTTEEIFKIFTHQNKADSAIHYFGIHKQLRDSILKSETLQQVAEIQTKYETEKKENQILLLEKESKSSMIQRNLLITLLILLLAFAIFMIRSYYINKKTNRLLRIQKTRIEWHKSVLDKKNVELLESNNTKNRLFQIISHDLRSPLASVYNLSQLIKIFIQQKKYDLLDESSKDMEECVNSVLNLTDNLLSWSLNQSGKLPYNPVIISLKPLLRTNIKTFSSVAKQKSIHLQLVLENEIFVFADRQMLDTVIRNLINNSLKFTLPGGIIAIGAKQGDGFIEIWVKDSGIGISEDQIPKLFEIDSSKTHVGTEGEKGNGLGLVLCKQFIEQNKGEIWVESIVNKGTTFRFTVPCGENTEEIGAILSSNSSKN